MARCIRPLLWTVGSLLTLAFLLFVWRLWNQGDERWITTLIGGPTTLFVVLVGVALVAEPASHGDRGGAITTLVVCLAILASVLL